MDKHKEQFKNEKIKLEIEKILLEIDSLKKPWRYNHSYIIALVTVFIASVTMSIQYFKSDRDFKLIEIKKERILLETEKLEAARNEIVKEFEQLVADLKIVKEYSELFADGIKKSKIKLIDAGELINKGNFAEAAEKIKSVEFQIENAPKIVTSLGYVIGSIEMMSDRLSLKKHSENPLGEPLNKGLGQYLDK